MKFSEVFQTGTFGLSFELFPPKTAAGETALQRHVAQLAQFRPGLITCTYGAGGTTRHKTLEIISQVRRQVGCSVAAHLTCVGSTTDQLRSYLAEADGLEIDNIVALRGDPPTGSQEFQAVTGGLAHANDLVALIRREYPRFGIAVAGYPETHREAASPEDDLRYLKQKVDSGAGAVLTQLFYRNDDFFRFRDRCTAIGISVPVVPGLLPITGLAQVQRIASLCGSYLPPDLIERLEAHRDDPDGQFQVGVDHATYQTQQLIDAGVPGVHFYVLNRSAAATRVLRRVARPEGESPTT
jgi:methylenetetrahydrofolate reductase (NADPH)